MEIECTKCGNKIKDETLKDSVLAGEIKKITTFFRKA